MPGRETARLGNQVLSARADDKSDKGWDAILSPAQVDQLMADLRAVVDWRFGSVTIEVVHGRVKRIQVMISKDVREGSG